MPVEKKGKRARDRKRVHEITENNIKYLNKYSMPTLMITLDSGIAT